MTLVNAGESLQQALERLAVDGCQPHVWACPTDAEESYRLTGDDDEDERTDQLFGLFEDELTFSDGQSAIDHWMGDVETGDVGIATVDGRTFFYDT